MNENIVVEIQNIENKADSIIADAHRKAKQLDVDAEDKIKLLTIDSEKEFQKKFEEIKLSIEKSKNDEAAQLTLEFEKAKAQLTNINQAVLEHVVESTVEELCEA